MILVLGNMMTDILSHRKDIVRGVTKVPKASRAVIYAATIKPLLVELDYSTCYDHLICIVLRSSVLMHLNLTDPVSFESCQQ